MPASIYHAVWISRDPYDYPISTYEIRIADKYSAPRTDEFYLLPIHTGIACRIQPNVIWFFFLLQRGDRL